MDIHFLEIRASFYEPCFAKKIFYKIFHQMTTTILTPIGIESGFYTCYIIYKIVDDMILHQIKQTRLPHEFDIVVTRAIRLIEMKIKLTFLIHSHNVKFTFSQKDWNTSESLWVLFQDMPEFIFNVLGTYKRIQYVERYLYRIHITEYLIEINIILIVGDRRSKTVKPSIEISHISKRSQHLKS